jgi:hypothetical protein
MRDLFVVLVRHFFGRFFDNELVSSQGEVHATLAKVIGLLASPGLICFWLMPKYTMLVFVPPKVAEAASLSDKMFFITFAMVVMGFVTVLEWDALFPDRRDFTILIPLPIHLPTIFAAKIVSLIGFVVMFFIAANAIHTFLYPFIAMGRYAMFLGVLGSIGVHATVMLAATAFIFFLFVAVQGVVMNVLSFRAFRRVSTYVQLLSVLALLLMLLLFLDTQSLIHSAKNRNLLYFFPPMWFLGWYETMLGQPEPLPGCREIAIRALQGVLVLSALSYAVSYKRHVKRSLEAEEILDVAPSRISTLLCAFANRSIVAKPLEQASFYFTGKTLVRSRKHWLYLAAYVGVGFALMLQALVGVFSRNGNPAIDAPNPSLLSVPLIVSFFVLSGMRVVFAIPAELKANWVFQLSEADGREECLAGVRKAMLIFGALPLFVALAPVYGFLWGWPTAVFHTFFDIVLSLLLIELLLVKFHKIPFTCSYLPGKANITGLWFIYWLGFATYAYSMASLEAWVLQNSLRIAALYLLGCAAVATAVFYRNRHLQEGFTLIFEDTPEPVVRTLNLSAPGSW